MAQTEPTNFTYYLTQPLTIDFLIANQTECDIMKILFWISSNPTLTSDVIQWLLKEHHEAFLQIEAFYSPLSYLLVNIQSIENFIVVIDHIFNTNNDLYTVISWNRETILHEIFANVSFDGSMLNYLYQRDPQLDISRENASGQSSLFNAIVHSRRLFELLKVIESNEPVNYRTRIRIKNTNNDDPYESTLVGTINKYAESSNSSTICALIRLCGELFPLIRLEFLSQDICTEAMSPLAKSILFK
jgi:hypothetical protein